jgi:LPXTG-motif cell wall-anchored protein
LVPGDYEVTENRNSLGDGWTVSGEGVVTVNANQAHSATITNVYTTPVVTIPDDTTPVDVPVVEVTNGTLTVRKIVTGDTSGMTLPAFEITVTGPEGFTTTKTFVHNESFTWVNLVPGEYTITENKTGLNSRWAVSGEGAAQVVANQTTMTTITNNYRNVVGIPQTSQNTDYGTAMALGMIALMLAGAGVLSAKTRKKYRA